MNNQARSPQLSVEIALRLTGPDGDVGVVSADRTIVVRPDGLRSSLRLLRSGPGVAWRRRIAVRCDAALDRSGLTLELRLGRWTLARLGRLARPTLASRLARTPELELRWPGLALGALSTVWASAGPRA